MHVADVLTDREYQWNEAQKIGGYRAALGAPLLRDGKVVGVIFVAAYLGGPFSPVAHIADHIEHVAKIGGEDCVALVGTDPETVARYARTLE